jgi:hypothetical protein
VIVASTPGVLAIRAAITTIPIVFTTASDPVQIGLVASLARPGGNLTGVQLNVEVAPKRLELAHELVPTSTLIAVLVNPTNPLTEALLRDLQAAASIRGVQLHVLHASTERDFDTVFATLAQLRAGALVIGGDAFFIGRSEQLAALTLRHAVPAIFQERAFVAAGGTLMVGTDPTGWGGTLPGPGNHAALRLLVEAGFTPLEVIRIATLNGARYQGIDDRVGSLAEGKRADLVLVDGKPDEDIRQLGRIDLVFKDGIAYDSKKIVESLKGKVGR